MWLQRLTVLIALIAALLNGAYAAGSDMQLFRIGTGSAGATYFPVGGLIALAVSNPPGSRPCEQGGSCGVPGLIAVAQTANGSIANIEALRAGRLESGLVQSDIAYWAYHGSGTFSNTPPYSDLRCIASLYPESMHLLVRKESGIRSIADLRGKRVSLGEAGAGTLVDALIVLKAYGLRPEQLQAEYTDVTQAIRKMRDGRLDAIFAVAGYPISAITKLARKQKLRLVPIDGPPARRLAEEIPFFTEDAIPAGTYQGIHAVKTLSVMAQWVTTSTQDEELIYRITRALWNKNSRKLLDSGHVKGRAVRLETALDSNGIPLHRGAERFYREIGLIDTPTPGPAH